MAEEQYGDYEFDPWSTTSGLPDKLTVRFDNPRFEFNAEVRDGKVLTFRAEGTILNPEDPSKTEFDQWYTCGDGWEPASKGQKAVREDGKPRPFNGGTNYALLFTSLAKAADEQGLMDELRKRGTPFDAGIWKGIVAYMEREKFGKFTGEDGKERDRELLVVNRIEKMPGAEVAASSEPESTTTAATKESPDGDTSAGNGDGGGIKPQVLANLRKLAREAGSFAQFQEKAFEWAITNGHENPEVEQAIIDEGPGSIWASVQE